MKSILLLFISFFFLQFAYGQTTYAVIDDGGDGTCSSAWPAEILGNYTENGTNNGLPCYEGPNGYWLYNANMSVVGQSWVVGYPLGSTDINGANVRFYINSSASTPPLNVRYTSTSNGCGYMKVTTGTATPPPTTTLTNPANVGTTSMDLYWSQSAGATGYHVYVSTNSSFTALVSGLNPKDVPKATTDPYPPTNTSISGLTAGTLYYIMVRAYNGAGESANSNTVSATTIPTSPVATSASSISVQTAQANWNSTSGVTGYKLYLSTNSGFTSYVSGYNGLGTGVQTSYNITELSSNTTYYYRLKAFNNSGESGYSNTISFTTLQDVTPPTVSSVSVPSNGTYTAAQNLDFTVNFDENVIVDTGGGTPEISLTIGSTTKYATYISGSGTSALVFRYTVQSGDRDSDGIALGTLSANGGTLKDAAGNNANLTLNGVGSTSSVFVDAVPPTVSNAPASVTVTEDLPSNVDLSTTTVAAPDGDALTVTINATEGTLAANSGGSVTVGGSGTAFLILSGTAANINAYLDTPSNIKYTSALNANGTAAATLTITPNDGTQDGTSATVNVDITAVNDDPSASGIPSSISQTEDVQAEAGFSSIVVSDPDAGSGEVTIKFSAKSGTMVYAAGTGITATGIASNNVTFTGTLSNLNFYLSIATNILYTPAQDVNGTGADSITVILNDNGNTGLGGGTDFFVGKIPINITPVNDPPVIDNVNGETSDILQAIGPQNIDLFDDATVSNVDSPDYNGGFLTISQGSGTANGYWGLDGTTATSGGDGTIAAGETISVGGTAIGTVHATNDGQGGNTLEVDFDTSNSTNANIQTLLRALTYAAPSSLGARVFTLTLNDADGTANGGDEDAAVSFTITITPNPPVLSNIDGDNAQINVGGTPGNIDVNSDAAITDADSPNFNGGNMTIIQNTGTANGSFSLSGLGTNGVSSGTSIVTANDTISGSEIIYVDGVAIASVSSSSDGQNGNNLIFNFGSNATPARTQALLRDLRYSAPSGLGDRTFTISLTDASSNATTGTANITISIIDDTPPTAVCQDITVWLDQNGTASITAAQIDGGSTDNNVIDTMWLDKYDFTGADLGENSVTLFVSDANGNTDSCTAIVTVADDILPVVKCNPITIYLDENGEYPLSDDDVIALSKGTTDNATSYEDLHIYANPYPLAFNCNDVGHQVIVQVFATDEAGNKNNCSVLVNVRDTIPLQVDDISDINVHIASGSCDTTIIYPYFSTPNKCAEFSQISGLGPNGDFPVGTTTEEWLLSNNRGDSLFFSFDVNVTANNLPPTLDDIADLDTNTHVSELIVPLSGISFGNDCADQNIIVTATNVNLNVINNLSVVYTSPDSTGQLILGINAGASGKDTVSVTVEDSEGGSLTKTFMVTIDYTNLAPQIVNPINDEEIIADHTLTLPLGETFDDPDGDMLSLELSMKDGSSLPAWISLTNDTLYAMPSIEDTACISLVITASDPSSASVSDTFILCVVGYPVGISDFRTNQLNLNMYPNPSNGFVTLEFNQYMNGEVKLAVTDISGRQVFQKTYLSQDRIQFDLSNQVSGMYFVNLEYDGHIFKKKLILKKN